MVACLDGQWRLVEAIDTNDLTHAMHAAQTRPWP